MRILRKLKVNKKLSIGMLALLMCVSMVSTAYADVSFSTDKNPTEKKIGVTGNPDYYPYEYFDDDAGEYKGVFPDLFAMLSARTKLDFQYINASSRDQRLVDQKTGYAQIVSAYIADEKEMDNYLMTNPVSIVDYEVDGEKVSICFAFGKYAEPEIIESVTEAMESITDDDIASLLGKHLNAKSTGSDMGIYIAIIAGLLAVVALAACVLAAIIIKDIRNHSFLKKKELQDPLTGIGNRKYFEGEFQKLVAFQYKASYVLAYIGFDIQKVNKYYGEDKAEDQLCYAANLLTVNGKKQEIAARIAGGAFGIMHICTSELEAREWAENLTSRLNVYTSQFDKDFTPKFRAGVYRLRTGNWDFNKAMKNAQRCYDLAVKKDCEVVVSDDAMQKQDQMNEMLSHEIDEALKNRQIVQFIQPIVNAKDGSISGAEGLARWNHPQMGLLLPDRFIQMMIDEGKVGELDMHLFEESCRKLEIWKNSGKSFRVSTNFARVSITAADFVQRIQTIAGKYNFERSNLVIEITEDTIENNKEVALANIKAMKNLGFRIAMDDLGSGFTFFSDLKDYPFDVIKMDRDMLLDIKDARGKALMEGLIRVCKNMGMEIICEGVETQEQYETVTAMGCDYIQGYYFFKPMSFETATAYM